MSAAPKPLDETFFNRPTITVARELLGCSLVHNGLEQAFEIVETEAYTEDDPACHGYQRKTGRAATLYKSPGLAYVYFIYGMYHCLNVVTEAEGVGGAVLIRALAGTDEHRTHGPGRLTKALGINASHNEIDLTAADSPLYLTGIASPVERPIIQTTRIGIKKAAEYPWRFYLGDSPWVSVKGK